MKATHQCSGQVDKELALVGAQSELGQRDEADAAGIRSSQRNRHDSGRHTVQQGLDDDVWTDRSIRRAR